MTRRVVRKMKTMTTKAQGERILTLDAQGLSDDEIAAAVGVSRGAVAGILHRKRIPLREPTNGNAPKRVGNGHTEGQSLIDPNRADKLLRRFSWEVSE